MENSPDLLFGSIAVEAGYLTREQVEAVAEEQAKASPRVPLGDLCLRKNLLTGDQVGRILHAQRLTELLEEDTLFGALAVRNGIVSAEEVGVALEAKEGADPEPRIGEILVDMGALTEQRVHALLSAQKRLRSVTSRPAQGNPTLAKIAPGLHPQRLFVIVAAALGALGMFLPWLHPPYDDALLGVHGWGWLTFFVFGVTIGLAAYGNRTKPLGGAFQLAVIVTAVVALFVVGGHFGTLGEKTDPGIGLYVVGILALAVPVVLFFAGRMTTPYPGEPGEVGEKPARKIDLKGIASRFARAKKPAPEPSADAPTPIAGTEEVASFTVEAPPPPPPVVAAPVPDGPGVRGKLKGMTSRGGDRLKRLFRDVTGKRAEEKNAALQRRDQLLQEIGEAAGSDGPEAESVAKASEGFEAAKARVHELEKAVASAGDPEKAAVSRQLLASKTGLKGAEQKLSRAKLKLGRSLVDKGDADAAKAGEVRAWDAKIKDLG